MTTKSHGRSRRAIAALVSAAVVVSIVSLGGGAQAETCTNGTPMRTLTEDETGFVANQVCLQGEWVSISRWQIQPEELVINEPRDTRYHLTAESFFDLKNYDPYAIITAFRDVVAGATKLTDAEKTDLLEKAAVASAQAILSRTTRGAPNANCHVRSQPGNWNGPQPFALVPGGPKVITYAFDPSLSSAQKVMILNAISQYHFAVDAQDLVGAYPEDIVLDDPSDPRPPTITFDSRPDADMVETQFDGTIDHLLGQTVVTATLLKIGSKAILLTARVSLTDRVDKLHPGVVAHEIGHALGIGHTPDDLDATMRPTANPVNTIRPWDVRNSHNDTPAFDACMFLPTE